MNSAKPSVQRCIFPLFALVACGLLTGCCVSTVERFCEIHEVMTPQAIIASDKGDIAIKVSCSYYSREQPYDRNAISDKPLAEYGSRVRFLVLDSRWIEGNIGKNTAAGGLAPIRDVVLNPQAPAPPAMIPAGFLDPGATSRYPAWRDAAKIWQYRLDQPVPYRSRNGIIYLSFAKTGFISHRTQKLWWANGALVSAEALDTVLELSSAAIAFPVAVVVVPVGFVVLAILGVCDSQNAKPK